MASATGIPENLHTAEYGEDEPLLGRPGDASQLEGSPLYYNLIIGWCNTLMHAGSITDDSIQERL